MAQVYDYGIDGAAHFIVMEYTEGSDRAHPDPEHGRLTPSDAMRVAERVCAALGAAHRSGSCTGTSSRATSSSNRTERSRSPTRHRRALRAGVPPTPAR